ncbi:MAG: hypothetical protein LBV75_02470 [Paludibacter sp.]|jgi:hypothetical protein|nr:hypothetical protein [Paludibacter sp.]
MKVKSLFLGLLLCISTAAFSQNNTTSRWSLEPFVAFGMENVETLPGMEYGVQSNYAILDRFGLQASLGSFQSLTADKSWKVNNSSYMLFSLNVFGDLISTQKGHKLRLSAGATYFRGDLVYFHSYENTANNNYNPTPVMDRDYTLNIYNNIGINVKLSYLCPLTDNWYLGVNLNGYDIIDKSFLQIASLGCSLGYKF